MNSKRDFEDPPFSRTRGESRSEEREVILAAMIFERGLSALVTFVLAGDPLAMTFFPFTEDANFLNLGLFGLGFYS